MQIVLLGYMGSGKTTIGKLLAEKLSIKFLDLDSYIEEAEGNTIKNIFKEKGEIYFRRKEAENLRKVLSTDKDFVLAIGGGTPCYANNMEAISHMSEKGIYLKLGLEELVNRLINEKSERPLIANIPNEDLLEFIGKHVFERSFFYNQANHVVNCNRKSADEIVTEIAEFLG